jgi:hypothetical protein
MKKSSAGYVKLVRQFPLLPIRSDGFCRIINPSHEGCVVAKFFFTPKKEVPLERANC